MSLPPESDDRDPQDLERKAEAIRADLDRTLNALERKLSPRQLLDRSIDYVQANGGDVLQKIGVTVSKNPLPLLVTSAGLIWLVAASRQSARKPRSSSYGASMSARAGEFDRSSQSFGSTSQSFGSTMHRRASGMKQRAARTLDAARSRAGRTWGATREHTQDLGQNLNGLIREQPLVCGAIALAVGAIIGAAFPASAFERDLVSRAREAGSDMLDDIANRSADEPLSDLDGTPRTAH
jgi:ElaB/YqjD/DUF883 family membrane-anchored ribosome-binding protein